MLLKGDNQFEQAGAELCQAQSASAKLHTSLSLDKLKLDTN